MSGDPSDEAILVYSDFVCPFCYLGKASLERLSRVYDVEMALEVARDVDSYPAHRLAALVREEYDPGTFRSFYRSVFEALWEEGRDIEDPQVLEACAETAEVDRSDVARALEELPRSKVSVRMRAASSDSMFRLASSFKCRLR